MDAFDADVLIYAAAPDHPLGRRVHALFPREAPTTDRFITNNASGFPTGISEIEVTSPSELPGP